MAYEKQNFIQGQVVTADDLNHMEEGIAEAHNHPVTSVGGKTGDVNADPYFADAVTATTDYGYARLYSSQYSLGLELKSPAMSQPTYFLTNPSDGNPGVSVNGNYGAIYTSLNPPPANLLTAYPVGSIYISVLATSPAALFGGTWERLPMDRFLMSGGDGTGGAVGGTFLYELVANIGAVNDSYKTIGYNETGASVYQANHPPIASYGLEAAKLVDYAKWNHSTVVSERNTNNAVTQIVPPYYAVCMWRRIA